MKRGKGTVRPAAAKPAAHPAGIVEAMRRAVGGQEDPPAEWNTVLAQHADCDQRGLLVIGPGRMVLGLNPACRSLLHYEGEVPRPVTEVVGDVSFGFIVGDVFHDGREVWHEAYAPDPDRLLRFHLVPIIDEHRITSAVVVSIEDITRLRQLETVRRDFVANVSHELRTPVASISLLVDTLRNGAIDEADAAAHFLERIQVEAESMGRLVEELLELSRLESGGLSLEPRPVIMRELLQRVKDRLGPLADERSVTVCLELQDSLPRVMADAGRLEQVLINLVHNAVKFTPARGQVSLRARRRAHGIQVEVADTGPGMDADEARRVFERFYKVDKARQRTEGAGLGLAIARHLVELHGSRLEVVSQLGQGSRFTFDLPTADYSAG